MEFLSDLLSFEITLLIYLLILIFHIIMFFIRDKSFLKSLKKNDEPEKITLDDLNKLPLINIIVPAWKEGRKFKDCLLAIKKLSYPHLKVIVNAGGDQKTINIAREFDKYDNFIILRQKKGDQRASLGKISALNECFNYINRGIVYFIDADTYITEEVLIRVVYPLINLNEKVVSGQNKPLKSQEDKDLVKYLQMNRNSRFRIKFKKYIKIGIAGANNAMRYEVIKKIGKFTESRNFATDRSIALDLVNNGYKIYKLKHYSSRIQVEFPDNIKELLHQKLIWGENFLIYSFKHRKANLIKFSALLVGSLIIAIIPFLIIINLKIFFLSLSIVFFIYLKKLRRIIFWRISNPKEYNKPLDVIFFIKIVFYIYIEAIIVILTSIHIFLVSYKLKN